MRLRLGSGAVLLLLHLRDYLRLRPIRNMRIVLDGVHRLLDGGGVCCIDSALIAAASCQGRGGCGKRRQPTERFVGKRKHFGIPSLIRLMRLASRR
jgi:hypothetical protein